MEFSREEARSLLLAAQGFSGSGRVAGKEDVLGAVRRMGVLQIDSISVVARSPYFVLWSRLGDYELRWLDELLSEGFLFEGWSHAACFIPIEDFGLYRGFMLDGREKARAWIEAHPEEVERVVSHIRENGPTRSAEFERTDGKKGGWWEWKPEKLALECLFSVGELMISRRDPNFHRVYDLRERVLPKWDDADALTAEEAARRFALEAVCALGVAAPGWVPDYFRTKKRGVAELLEELADEGAVLRASIEGDPAFVHPENVELAVESPSSVTTLLSPFDPVVWDRGRASELFGFEYKIEVYTPKAKRRYGYYSLPILHRGALVGRLDAKAHRKNGVFEVKAAHLEPGTSADEDLISSLASTLRECARWHGTPEVEVGSCDPPALAKPLRAEILAAKKRAEVFSAPKKLTG